VLALCRSSNGRFLRRRKSHEPVTIVPNAALRATVTSSAGPAGATLQLLEQADG
jgi:hypothetical protein